jgi:hypothetical protein
MSNTRNYQIIKGIAEGTTPALVAALTARWNERKAAHATLTSEAEVCLTT